MAGRGVASGQRLRAAERREMAWELRKNGYSFRKIAETLAGRFGSYSKSQAERDVKFVLDELLGRTLEDAAAARAIDLERLDDLLTAWFRSATDRKGPDKDAAGVVAKVLEQRAKLLGLYRQEVALVTPAPLQVAADLSGLDEESLDAIIRNLSAASGAGAD